MLCHRGGGEAGAEENKSLTTKGSLQEANMGWQDLQRELAEAFTTDAVFGKKIESIAGREAAYGLLVKSTFKGYEVIINAFQEFFAESLEFVCSVWKEPERKPTPPTYAEIVRWHLANFKNLRAASACFYSGYPLDGLALLRRVKESALFLAALLSGITTYQQLNGDDLVQASSTAPFTRKDLQNMRERRKKEEARILGIMIRKNSGLPTEILNELGIWEDFFHFEVHGSRLTRLIDIGHDKSTSVAPIYSEMTCAMFLNRFLEICWMLHRTLPILQLSYRQFDELWLRRWNLLDANFTESERGLAAMGKKLAGDFITFMNTKLGFEPTLCFDTHVRFR